MILSPVYSIIMWPYGRQSSAGVYHLPKGQSENLQAEKKPVLIRMPTMFHHNFGQKW